MARRFVLVFCIALLASSAAAQESKRLIPATLVVDELATAGAAATKVPGVAKEPFTGVVAASAGGTLLHYVAGRVIDKEAYKALVDAMALSSATQVGSTSDSGGSTSVAMKGLVPAILGFAVEHGAISKDVNETVATFRVSPAGLVKALQGNGLLDIYQDYANQPGFRFASRFSGSVSFDTSLGDSPGTLLADEQQLTGWSVNVTLFNFRDPRAKRYAPQFRTINAEGLVKARERLDAALVNWTDYADWRNRVVARVRKEVDAPWAIDGNTTAAADRFKSVLAEELQTVDTLSAPPASVVATMSTYIGELRTVLDARNDIVKFANEGAIGTFDWTTTRDEKLPDLYTLTGVYENSFGKSRKDDFTANAVLKFYRSVPTGGDNRVKDFNFTAQWDRPLGSVLEIPFIFTAATKYQYIPKDVPVPASALVVPDTTEGTDAPPAPAASPETGIAIAPKGHLWLGQAKLTIPLKSGARIPLSVTFANRTELIKEKDVRANFGITFDLDAFIAAVRSR